MTLTSDDPATDYEQADALARAGSSIAALARYRELLAADPARVEARLRLARLLDRLEERDEALAILSQGIGRDPDLPDLLLQRGIILTRMRRYDEADADFRRVLRVDPSSTDAEVELGLLAWHRGLRAEATAHFRRALQRSPGEARIYTYLADTLNQGNDLSGAYEALVRALELNPMDAKACHLMGRVLDRLGRPEEAWEMYHRSRELSGK